MENRGITCFDLEFRVLLWLLWELGLWRVGKGRQWWKQGEQEAFAVVSK